MEEEKFNKLMERYVNSTARGKEADLVKLQNKTKPARSFRAPKFAWVLAAVLLILIVSLSVALPIVLKENEQKIYYGDTSYAYDIRCVNCRVTDSFAFYVI